ncbi:hypothetical protein [Chitinophaga solisilvae]|uniref:hypothetical protein n=1 Tax=Chitinophaga solisilvae TaxID=1233460 RepID=UPI001370084C|nr:hypothetical protein [Chitinophaga solisilvae]
MKNYLLTLLLLLTGIFACKKNNATETPATRETAVIRVEKSADTVVPGQPLIFTAVLKDSSLPVRFFYSLKQAGNIIFTQELATSSFTWKAPANSKGAYTMEVTIRKNGQQESSAETVFQVIAPNFGVALTGTEKSTLLAMEKEINSQEPGQPFELFSRYHQQKGIEVLYYRNKCGFKEYAYFIKDNRLIGGEGYYAAPDDNIYQFFRDQLTGADLRWFSTAPVQSYVWIHNIISTTQLNSWLQAKDYTSVSGIVNTGKFSERYQWNGKRDKALISVFFRNNAEKGVVNKIYLQADYSFISL